MKKVVDCYKINIEVVLRKKYWDADNDSMDEDIIKDKMQQGLEVPIEDISVRIEK